MTATTTRPPTAGEPAEATAPTPPPAPARRGRGGLVIAAVVLAVGLVGAAFVLRSGGGDDPARAEPEPPKAGEVVPLDALTLNLADGRLARVGVAVELTERTTAADWDTAGGPSRMSDAIIARIGALRADEVTAERVKDELQAAGADRFGDEFHGVFLTELVVQ